MKGLDKLRIIAKAKFSDKKKLGDWYKKRLEICADCPINSKNKKELTVREKAMVVANLGNPTCLACGCEIAAKASVRGETCGLVKVNQVPLWTALPEIESIELNKYQIENLSKNVVKMTTGTFVVLDYGIIKEGSSTDIELSVESKEGIIESLNVSSSCSCTAGTTLKKEGKYYIRIAYDSKRVGVFNKYVTLRINRSKGNEAIKINIIGTVIK